MNPTDEHWELARSIQLTPANETLPPNRHGVVIARRHAAGWFVSARYDPNLSETDRAEFAQFAMVRTYLLLEEGPRPHVWDSAEDSWRTYCLPTHIDLDPPIPITA